MGWARNEIHEFLHQAVRFMLPAPGRNGLANRGTFSPLLAELNGPKKVYAGRAKITAPRGLRRVLSLCEPDPPHVPNEGGASASASKGRDHGHLQITITMPPFARGLWFSGAGQGSPRRGSRHRRDPHGRPAGPFCLLIGVAWFVNGSSASASERELWASAPKDCSKWIPAGSRGQHELCEHVRYTSSLVL